MLKVTVPLESATLIAVCDLLSRGTW